MVQDAEDYREDDRLIKERTDAKNSLEGYLYNLKNLLEDDGGGVASKISDADREVSVRFVLKLCQRSSGPFGKIMSHDIVLCSQELPEEHLNSCLCYLFCQGPRWIP